MKVRKIEIEHYTREGKIYIELRPDRENERKKKIATQKMSDLESISVIED